LRDDEPPDEESKAMQDIRAWRASERKSMVESIEKLISQAQRMALSRYTRSAQRAKWTRLAGQLLWYKDQILRAMTWEALEQDVKQAMRDEAEFRRKQSVPRYPVIQPFTSPASSQPTILKKKEEQEEDKESIYSDNSSKESVA
jgi:hypothetical protein